jgi:chemotaxis protein methyltransferase CheR
MAEAATSGNYEREFSFSDSDFEEIRKFVKEHTGISLSEAKKNMVYSRLSRRLRQLNLEKFSDYLSYVNNEIENELGNFVNAITTNLTAFFREQHHFDYLRETIIPQLRINNDATRRIRIWSAGCSTGEEPYSIAMTLLESFPDIAHWDIRILATDLDTNVVAHAERGVYDIERLKSVPTEFKKRYFLKGRGQHQGNARVISSVRDLITFRKLNLMTAWPMAGPFDLIFCRNVVIYFDKDTQRTLFDRFANILIPRGNIFLGHSESLFKVSDRFELIRNTMYQKKQ